MLREPLEIGEISIARAQRSVTLPARFQLIAAMNPCPCGHLGHPSIPCRDTPQQIEQYRRKLSGPLLDRIDMHVEVPFQSAEFCLKGRRKAEPSDRIRARVESVREMQMKRQNCLNAELEGDRLLEICDLSSEQLTWLARTIDALALSGRSTHRVLRLARTLADCAGRQQIEQGHLASALRYRPIRQQ